MELARAQIHADRAGRQFDACEPENRLIARSLEREWEQRLTDVRRAEHARNELAAGALTACSLPASSNRTRCSASR